MRALLVLLGACGFSGPQLSGTTPIDAPIGGPADALDAAPQAIDGAQILGDAPLTNPDAPPTCTTFSTQFDTCTVALAGVGPLGGSDRVYNTDTHVLSDPNGNNPVTLTGTQQTTMQGKAGPINVWLVSSFVFAHNLRVVGSVPFGIVSDSTITLMGSIDASAGGAGAPATCGVTDAKPGEDDSGGAAGGGGGSFHGVGGTGGNGNGGTGVGGIGGLPMTTAPLGPRGGCPGAHGGKAGGLGGIGGTSGGAIYLVARTKVEIAGSGKINAGGGGGAGGNAVDGGGGGGGSGGMIMLESTMIALDPNGVLAANGGGGGGGYGGSGSGPAGSGLSGTPNATPAMGGVAPTSAGTNGGVGSAGATLTGASVTTVGGGAGGGGGGGAGFITTVGSFASSNGVRSPSS